MITFERVFKQRVKTNIQKEKVIKIESIYIKN